mmetsp:Transcript_45872/g.76442  ORF Transcript_45872/g.76442 Transcript_45872/m.76442 type:complete len:185 (-) Transcript_45872:105-659(-)
MIMSTKEQARKASECHRQKMLKKTMCQQRKQQRAILREMKRKEREKEAVEKESQRRLARANHSDMDLDIRVPREVGRKTALGTFRCSSDMHVFNVQLIDWNAFQEKDGKYNLDFTANAFCAMEGEMLLIPWRNPMVEEGQVIDDIRNKIMRPCKPVLGDELMEARAARFSRRGWTMMDSPIQRN